MGWAGVVVARVAALNSLAVAPRIKVRPDFRFLAVQ